MKLPICHSSVAAIRAVSLPALARQPASAETNVHSFFNVYDQSGPDMTNYKPEPNRPCSGRQLESRPVFS